MAYVRNNSAKFGGIEQRERERERERQREVFHCMWLKIIKWGSGYRPQYRHSPGATEYVAYIRFIQAMAGMITPCNPMHQFLHATLWYIMQGPKILSGGGTFCDWFYFQGITGICNKLWYICLFMYANSLLIKYVVSVLGTGMSKWSMLY